MRKIISISVLILILATSCSKNENNNNDENANVNENNNEIVNVNKDNENIETTEADVENENENEDKKENNDVETNVIKKEAINSVIVKSDSYSGTISDIPIKMQLDYYESNAVTGTYYYEKYKENIELIGEMKDDIITLKTYDNSEKFVGTVDGNFISGEWISGSTRLNFEVASETSDIYATSAGKAIVYDDDSIYYSFDNTLYKCDYEISVASALMENQEFNNLILHNDKIYFTGSNYDLKRVNTDGSNLENLDKNYGLCATDEFVIYKDRIYFADANSMWATSIDYFKLISIDLDGGNPTETLVYSGDLNDNKKYREYHISFIYDDYIYFAADVVESKANLFRTKLDGSEMEIIDVLAGDTIGAFNDKIYYVPEYSTDIWTKEIDSDVNMSSVLYSGIKPIKNNEVIRWKATIDGDYIIITDSTESDNLYHIIILDLDGNVVNENHKLGANGYPNANNISTTVINDEIYYINTSYTSPNTYSIGRYKIIN